MSDQPAEGQLTHHAMLVIWGHFARQIGLVSGLDEVVLSQKTYHHRPHTKVLEFLVAMLGGLAHLKDVRHAAHPIDQDSAVAEAWQQGAWADASGVSRTLQALTMDEAGRIGAVLERVSQPFIEREVLLAVRTQGRVIYDADLTGRPVSNSSTSYPDVAYGPMSDHVQLGYQAALVSMQSPTYGRLWVSVKPHPGNTIACTQAEASILAAEACTHVRPRRRTELVQARLEAAVADEARAGTHLAKADETVQHEQAGVATLMAQVQQSREALAHLEQRYRAAQRPERPTSQLAQARERLGVMERRLARGQARLGRVPQACERLRVTLTALAQVATTWRERLARFEAENAATHAPIQAVIRLDAGFGTAENVAVLIEMGYDLYTKPYNHQVTTRLRRQLTDEHVWTRVGANAEMIAFADHTISGCPYTLDLALERFYTGETIRSSTLLHYGSEAVTTDLPAWFAFYNARQVIEAGIKEGQAIFQMHHLKVRAAPALWVQEQFAVFAANLVRWAAHWLDTQCPQVVVSTGTPSAAPVKEFVHVGAHTSAWVSLRPDGYQLVFTSQSAYAGHCLQTGPWALQLPLPLFESCLPEAA